jgi:hypothetical protein
MFFRVSVFVCAVVIGVVFYAFYTRSNLVLLKYRETGRLKQGPLFSIFNPFRDRTPENSSETFLQQLKAGVREKAISEIQTITEKDTICEQEQKFPLISWRLMDRDDEGGKTTLYYKVKRSGYKGNDWGNFGYR